VRDGSALLIRRATEPFKGSWDIPGGFCEQHELPAEAAAREVAEETGLPCRITATLGMWLDTYGPQEPNGEQEVTLNVCFVAEALDDRQEPRPDPREVQEIGWFRPDSLPADLAFPKHIRPALLAWAATSGADSVLPDPIAPDEYT